jgi:cytochrome c556
MKYSKIALVALLLWVVTIAVFGWYFIMGNTTAGTEGRTAVVLQVGERDFVLAEMRGLLSATQEIIEGANQGDWQRIYKAAHAAGMAGATDVNPALMAKLPIEFKTLGMSVHHDMDDIAHAATGGASTQEIMKMLSNTLTKCVACHSTWQLQAAKSTAQN